METEDLLIFPESDAPVYNYFTNEKELIETKQKVKELEDKLKQFESRMMKLETENNGLSIFPILDTQTQKFKFYNMNAETIKILGNTLLIDDQIFCSDLMQFWGNGFEFLKQYKRVKQFIIDNVEYRGKIHYSYGGTNGINQILIDICRVIIKNNCEIVFKSDTLRESYHYNDVQSELFSLFQSTIYRKITIDIKNNLNIVGDKGSYVSSTFVTETKKYCDKNNIEFTSNIGL